MKHKTGKVIMGATLSLAAIAVAIDHTQHKLPEVDSVTTDEQDMMDSGNPCGLGASPCSLGEGGDSLED